MLFCVQTTITSACNNNRVHTRKSNWPKSKRSRKLIPTINEKSVDAKAEAAWHRFNPSSRTNPTHTGAFSSQNVVHSLHEIVLYFYHFKSASPTQRTVVPRRSMFPLFYYFFPIRYQIHPLLFRSKSLLRWYAYALGLCFLLFPLHNAIRQLSKAICTREIIAACLPFPLFDRNETRICVHHRKMPFCGAPAEYFTNTYFKIRRKWHETHTKSRRKMAFSLDFVHKQEQCA